MHRAIITRWPGRALPPSVRVLTQAGGRLGTDVTRQALAWMTATGGRFYCMYGQTEATARISCLDPSRLTDKLGSAGTALPGGRITIGPPGEGTALAPDGTGEIGYTGPNVMMGYAASHEDLARGSEVAALATGDLGRLDSEGFLYVSGRSSRFTKVQDHRVSLDDVEEWFGRGDECAAVALHGENPAIMVFAAGGGDRLDQARKAMAAALGAPPSAIAVRTVAVIPRTANGKVDYGSLQRMAQG